MAVCVGTWGSALEAARRGTGQGVAGGGRPDGEGRDYPSGLWEANPACPAPPRQALAYSWVAHK